MTFEEFHNGLRILLNIDQDEFEAGVDDSSWPVFRNDPHRWFIQASDKAAQRLWALMQARMRP